MCVLKGKRGHSHRNHKHKPRFSNCSGETPTAPTALNNPSSVANLCLRSSSRSQRMEASEARGSRCISELQDCLESPAWDLSARSDTEGNIS